MPSRALLGTSDVAESAPPIMKRPGLLPTRQEDDEDDTNSRPLPVARIIRVRDGFVSRGPGAKEGVSPVRNSS